MERIVLQNMIHKCSPICRPNKEPCRKGFPNPFQAVTEWNDNDFYPKYRQRSKDQGGREIRLEDCTVIDHRLVVPYNPYLSLSYDAHINVEICVSPTAAKYLFKYIHKGPDRQMVDVDYDEVNNFQNMRSIGASEACWKICGFPITA